MTMHTRSDYAFCADQGMTMRETAARLRVGYDAAQKASKAHGLKFKPDRMGRKQTISNTGILARSAIIDTLRRPMTSLEICAATGMEYRATMYHLNRMAREGLIKKAEIIIGRIWEPIK